jgi:uncharacterized protein (DUF1684 family)
MIHLRLLSNKIMKYKILLALSFVALLFPACGSRVDKAAETNIESGADYNRRIESWREGYKTKLVADDGWLTLAGLFWLNDGKNSIGVGEGFDIALPLRLGPGKFGEIEFEKGVARLLVEKGIKAFNNDRQISEILLEPDATGNPTIVKTNDLEMHVIKRNEKFGLRIRDLKSPERIGFKGLHWFSIDKTYEIEGDFDAFDQPKEIPVPNVLSQTIQMKSPGIVTFTLDGKKHTIQPVLNGDGRYFFIFRDLSSKTATYGGGRFLYTEPAKKGKVILDFNKAENPPCAYTEFATCPLPPKQNDLEITLNAGEKNYGDH